MSVRFLPVFPLLTIGLSLILTAPLQAQVQVSNPPQTSGDAVSKSPDGPKLPMEKIQPYSKWEHHVAEKAEEAIVPVRYSEAGKDTKILATGLIVRCDGFILVPRVVRDTGRLGGLIQVTLAKVDGGNSKEPITAVARYSPHTHATVPYGLIKTNGYHVRCLPMLASENVAVGKSVRILWYSAKDDAVTAIASRKATIDTATSTQDTYSLSPTDQSQDSIPFGAFVIDEESGAAVGMVTQAGTHPAFITLARFNVISSDVGLAPDRSAVRLGDRSGSLPPGSAEMVWVPGGPVALDSKSGRDFQTNYGVNVACTPGVWVAVHPVTNAEYRNWLLKEVVRRLPAGWTQSELEKPIRRQDFPACGMLVADADFYASSRHSRLPTEVEWRRAAYTEDVSWVEEISQNWETDRKQFKELYDQQRIYANTLVAEAQQVAQERLANNRNRTRADSQVNLLLTSTPELDGVAESILQLSEDILHDDSLWGQVMPITAYPQDKSVFGVRNVLINAPELVLVRVQGTNYTAPKYLPAGFDPYLSNFSWSASRIGSNKNNFALGKDEPAVTPGGKLQKVILASIIAGVPPGWNLISTSILFPNDEDRSASGVFMASYSFQAILGARECFRCAR
jgi:hypothetical protein